jgi:DNA processing protein
MARGCDGAAHRGALDAGGRTVAVLGCGADVAYPAEHRGMLRAVRASGAVVSEYAPGTPPRSWMFPLRNRIISGLSRAVVIVEASAKSGSLITAACALEQGRDVMAVPGGVFGERHRGCHALLRDGARLVQSAADVLDELGWSPTPPGPIDTATPGAGDGWLAPGEACDLDTLAARAGLAPGPVLSTLSQLELAGSVRRGAGGVFIRVRRQ